MKLTIPRPAWWRAVIFASGDPWRAPGVSKLYGEGPKVFRFAGHYWLLKGP